MKAQFWSFDAIFALIIFLSAVVVLSYVWLSMNNELSIASGFGVGTMQIQVQNLAARVTSQGSPTNWYSSVNALSPSSWGNMTVGLGTGQGNALSYQEILTLAAMANYNYTTYEATKPLLGVSFDYYIVINNGNAHITIGRNPQNYSATSIQVVTESVNINSQPVQVQTMLWSNTSSGIV